MRLQPATFIPCIVLGFQLTARGYLDQNADGINDVWAVRFSASGLAPGDDGDGDGRTNLQESEDGTDPRDATSRFTVNQLSLNGTTATVTFGSVAGKLYCLQSSADLATWTQATSYVPGTGGQMSAQATVAADATRKFFRACAQHVDTDGDGANDWEELTAQFGIADPQSAVPGQSDLVSLTAAVNATTSTITASAVDASAYEANAANNGTNGGMLRITRTGALPAVTVTYGLSGRPVAGSDYVAIPGAGTATFAFGVNRVDIPVTPLADSHLEVPETLTLAVNAGTGYSVGGSASAGVRIEDFETQVEKLYYTSLVAVTGVSTTASGFATIFLSGDHTTFRISANFSGLTSAQTAVHLHYEPTGQNLFSLPLGQIQNELWTLPANGTGALTSDQAILDALVVGDIYVNIHSSAYTAGEIEGNFTATTGSIDFVPPDAPPATPVYTGEAAATDVRRFLSQTTFGQTDALYTAASGIGITAWMNQQMDPAQVPRTVLKDWVKATDNWLVVSSNNNGGAADFAPNFISLIHGWWNLSEYAPDQLRQRVALALSEIFVVGINNSTVRNRHYGTADYWDTLARDAFGNFRTLLEDVSVHPIMASYLSMIKNEPFNPTTGVSPDENYAREVMQLFTIGLVGLHPDGSLRLDATTGQPLATYDNNDITELARVFTGWSFAVQQAGGIPRADSWNNNGTVTTNNSFFAGGGASFAQASFYTPMKMFAAKHDTGAKTIVGGVNIAAGLTGEQDMDAAMDALFNHPNTPPFIARRLIQRLVTSNPSRGYIYRVAKVFENDGTGERGDLGAVVRAILTDYEARSQDIVTQSGYGKMREPLLRATQFLRSLKATSGIDMGDIVSAAGGLNAGYTLPYPVGSKMLRLSNTEGTLGQGPFGAPSVFNWFLPDYTITGEIQSAGLVAPEFQITNESQVVSFVNYFSQYFWTSTGTANTNLGINGDVPRGYSAANARISVDLTAAEAAYTNGGTAGLLDYLEDLYLHEPLNATARGFVQTAVDNTATITGSTATREKVKTAVYLILMSPEFTIQR